MVTAGSCHWTRQAPQQAGLDQVQLALPVKHMIRLAVENRGVEGGFLEHNRPGSRSKTVLSNPADMEQAFAIGQSFDAQRPDVSITQHKIRAVLVQAHDLAKHGRVNRVVRR